MNDVFSFKRFGLLLKTHWAENKKKELLFFLLMVTVIIFFLSVQMVGAIKMLINNIDTPNSTIYTDWADKYWFVIIGVSFLVIMTGRYFSKLSNNQYAISKFSIPSSPLERLAAAFLSIMIIYPVLFFVSFYIIDVGLYYFFSRFIGMDEMLQLNFISFNNYFGFFTLLSLLMFGSLFFKNHGALKAILCFAVYLVLSISIVGAFIPEGALNMSEFTDLDLLDRGTGNRITINGFMYYFKYLLLPLLWILSYMKLKEREV